MSPSQQLAARRAGKAARRDRDLQAVARRLKQRMDQAPPNICAGLPVSVMPGIVRDRLMTKSLKRQMAADANPADWSTDQINELIFMHNTICRALDKRPNVGVKQATQEFCVIIERIRERKCRHGHYGATGEEWQAIKRHVNTLQTYLETLPGGVLFAAEEAAGRWHELNKGSDE